MSIIGLLLKTYLKKFEEYCKPKSNNIYNRYLFKLRVQKESKTFEQFVTELKTLIKDCEYPDDIQDEQIKRPYSFRCAVKQNKTKDDFRRFRSYIR